MYYAWFVKLVCIAQRAGLFLRAIQYNEISEVSLWCSFQPVYSNWQCRPMALALSLGWQHCWGHGGAGASQPRQSCFKTNPLFCQITAVFIGGVSQVIAALLLLLFLLLLCEWLHFHGISIFLRWVKISSEVKDGKKIKCSGTESCGWSTWDHLSWWPIPRKCFSPGVFLTPWMMVCQLSHSSGQWDVPVSLWFPFFPPPRHGRYSSCAAPKGCSLRKPLWQLFQVVRGSPEVPWFSGCVTFCWHFSCSTGLSHLPVVISLLANESCFSALAGLLCG